MVTFLMYCRKSLILEIDALHQSFSIGRNTMVFFYKTLSKNIFEDVEFCEECHIIVKI